MKDIYSTERLLEIAQKNDMLLKTIYSFYLKDRKVKVVFSDNPAAATIEDVLVKIAARRIS